MYTINPYSETSPNSSLSSHGTTLLQKIRSASSTRNIATCVLWTTRFIAKNIRPYFYKICFNSLMNIYNLSSLNTQLVPRSKHSLSFIETSHLMLHREITAICSENLKKQINTSTLCGKNVEIFYVKPGDTYSNHHALKHYYNFRFLLSRVSTKIVYAFNTLIMRVACRSTFPKKVMKHCRRLLAGL
jgi:hypothetical protein